MGSAVQARGDDGSVGQLDRYAGEREGGGASDSAGAIPLIVIAGVPGAGKTEALRVLRGRSPQARSADPENLRRRLRQWMPWLPYALVRPILHTIAHLCVLALMLNKCGDRWSSMIRAPADGVADSLWALQGFSDIDR